jgi:hypothetical protein
MAHGRFCRLYRIWSDMRIRCNNPNSVNYPWYGAKGVRVCAEWDDYGVFRAWAVSHGYAKALTLDREDSNGDYAPSNCRWATRQEQQTNTSRTIHLTVGGVTKPLAVWAREFGASLTLVRARIRKGWNGEQALTTPPIPSGKSRPGVPFGRYAKTREQIQP